MNTPTRIILMASIGTGLALAQDTDRNTPPGAPDRPLNPAEGRLPGERNRPDAERRRVEGDRPDGERPGTRREGGDLERPRQDGERPKGDGDNARHEGERRRLDGEPRRPEGERLQGDRRPDGDQIRGQGERGRQPGERGFGEGGVRPNARGMSAGGGEGGSRPDVLARLPEKPQPYIGIVTRNAGPDLAAQLKQPEGFGLVIDEVLPDSPAKSAGLERNDLLVRFEDQVLVNPPQLEALIRRAGKDKEAALTVLRGGAEQKVTVRVGEKMLPQRRGLPFENEGRMQMPMTPGQNRPFPNPRIQSGGGEVGAARDREDGNRQVRYAENRARAVRSDEQGRYELTSIDGTRTFTAQKPDGSVEWKGPVETAAQKEAVPAELKKKLEMLERTISPGANDRDRVRTIRE